MKRFEMLDPDVEKKILDRAKQFGEGRLALAMDLAAANAVCPLDGEKLLAFPDFDFWHDIHGIHANIDREMMGRGLMNHFIPRCVKGGAA